MTDRIKRTIDLMIWEKTIPSIGLFDITENHLQSYTKIYGELFTEKNSKFNFSYARKLAGLNLLKLKFARNGNSSNCKEGLVYTISNPAWPNHVKIGMTVDLDKRLDTYQTYDPHRMYRVKHYDFVLDRRTTERDGFETI